VPVESPGADVAHLARVRREYETSLSWRITRPLRAAGHIREALRPQRDSQAAVEPSPLDRIDSWLEQFYGDRLAAIDELYATSADPGYAPFREFDDDLWALLLSQQYELYPHIRAFLPSVPPPEFQELWNGRSGLPLATQSNAFYGKLKTAWQRHGDRPLGEASVLDFGCGWGRMTRYLARDVAPGRLYGCDPVEGALALCRANGVAATLARSEFLPERIPFAERFQLAFAFSVFTHLSERAHEQSLLALHRALDPQGILIVTVRPPAYLALCEPMRAFLHSLGADARSALKAPRYMFAPHPPDPGHPVQHGDESLDYGETVVTMAYIQERWTRWFDLLDVSLQLEDPHQVILTMRRK
jgi:SAM-dependent methyltransferase